METTANDATRVNRRYRSVGVSLVMAALFLSMATPAVAAITRHVAIAGTDTGDCASAAAPCRTITYALSQSATGDTILVSPGEYVEIVKVAVNGITIEGADPATTIVTGPDSCAGLGTPFPVFASDVTLRGLGIGGCPEGVVAIGTNLVVDSDHFLLTTAIGVSLAGGSATVVNSTFRSPTGVCDRAPGSVVVLRNTFHTQEYAFCVNFADATIHFNRITDGSAIGVAVGPAGRADLDANWWGCNEGPNQPGCTTVTPLTAAPDTWLRLERIDPPATLAAGGTVDLTFGLVDSATGDVAAEFPSAPISFSATVGSLEPEAGTLVDGVATTTYTAPNEAGAYTVRATLDEGTASVTLNAPVAPSSSAAPATIPTPPPTSTHQPVADPSPPTAAALVAMLLLSLLVAIVARSQGRYRPLA